MTCTSRPLRSVPYLRVAAFCLPVNHYTTLVTPVAWRACETFIPRGDDTILASTASDVFMLGCTYIEVLTGCTRKPFDWLLGTSLVKYRQDEATRNNTPIMVSPASCGEYLGDSCSLIPLWWCMDATVGVGASKQKV